MLARRAERGPAAVERYAEQLAAAVMAAPPVAEVLARAAAGRGGCVAAYVGVGTEPGTLPLLEALRDRGVRVLLPVLREDWSMGWGAFASADALVTSPRGLLEPATSDGSLDEAEVVLLPGLAVGPDGARLGRGGGAYDRALVDVTGTPLLVLLHPDEVGLDVPAEPHDRPVDGWVTSDGVGWVRPA